MIFPSQAFYRPNQPVEIIIPGLFRAQIWHLGDCVTEIEGENILRWQPPAAAKRGYRVRAETANGVQWTAFDVLDTWTDAPRYGYLFDFRPERTNVDLDWLLTRHINGIQFYDWMYRHDTLLPPQAIFDDPLGRPMSLDVVRKLVDEAHARGMAAMPYTAVYAASPAFAERHPEWGLYDENGTLYDFAEGFLKITNPASGWREHFVSECVKVLNALPFDGMHVDQYGEPKAGFNADGNAVNLWAAIADTLRVLHDQIAGDKTLLFNLVHNEPLEEIAATPVDFLYCELWSPMVTLGDLAHVAALNREKSGGRVPVMAVYIDPTHEHTVKLTQSVIMASGAYHLAHGEDGLYLSDPYFPKAQCPSQDLSAHLQRLADFAVAYEELLSFSEPIEARVSFDSDLWCLTRWKDNHLVINLLNAIPDETWNSDLSARILRENARVTVEVSERVRAVWCVSSDEDIVPQTLAFTQAGTEATFVVPRIHYWTLVCIELF